MASMFKFGITTNVDFAVLQTVGVEADKVEVQGKQMVAPSVIEFEINLMFENILWRHLCLNLALQPCSVDFAVFQTVGVEADKVEMQGKQMVALSVTEIEINSMFENILWRLCLCLNLALQPMLISRFSRR